MVKNKKIDKTKEKKPVIKKEIEKETEAEQKPFETGNPSTDLG